jgi:hypothetical protein
MVGKTVVAGASPRVMLQVAVAFPALPDNVAGAHDAGTAGLLGPAVSVNVTDPVGVTVFPVTGLGTTVAVNTTVWPVTAVDVEAAMVVVLAPWEMVSLTCPEFAA